MKRVVTAEVVEAEHAAGGLRITAPPATSIVTPDAWTKARELGVEIDAGQGGAGRRDVDPSGVLVVRGDSVQLAPFPPAGPGKNVRLADVVTAKDGAPMTAGFMSFRHQDAFAWSLDYDEVDYVVEGVLQIEIDGRKVTGRVGDVVYIPKGSKIIFGTPSRVKVFYVTYPADWAAAGNAPPRPLK